MSRTFSLENKLPNLLVPPLENTIEKYLYSVRAVATDEQYKRTSDICKNFVSNEGPYLQKKLKEREKSHRNWIEKIWLDQGYLELRIPLPFLNFFGVSSFHEQCWPLQEGTQVERASLYLFFLYKFWKMLYEEEMKPHLNNKGDPFSMHQLRSTFNTCRVPKRKRDIIVNHFKTLSEGKTPTHVIVLSRGHIFKINLVDPGTGLPYTPPQFEIVIQKIIKYSASLDESPGVAALTALDRDTWADVRDHLLGLSNSNCQTMNDIESAISILSLDDEHPQNFSDLLYIGANGDARQRWRDKSYNAAWSINGGYSASVDHSTVDGMVFVLYHEFIMRSLLSCNGKWSAETNSSDSVCEFEQLIFELDNIVKNGIARGKLVAKKLSDDITVLCNIYDQVGKIEIRKLQIYPDAFVQICVQLAYMRMHGKPAPTYETATTRQFYHGRTETCRTCIPELVQFCQAFINKKPTKECRILLRSAHDRLLWLMRECQNNRGCDRHLFGLSLAAAELSGPTPEIFKDPMYTYSGGNANFVLSTSFVGFSVSSGGALPMIEDGYGVFYRINDHRIVVSITAWNYSKVTDARAYWKQLVNSFSDVYSLFNTESSQL